MDIFIIFLLLVNIGVTILTRRPQKPEPQPVIVPQEMVLPVAGTNRQRAIALSPEERRAVLEFMNRNPGTGFRAARNAVQKGL